MKYLDSPNHRSVKRLDVIMGLIPVVGDMPYKELDALYSHIFSCVEDLCTTLKILEFLLFGFKSPFTPDFMAILGLDDLPNLSELHSILPRPTLVTWRSDHRTLPYKISLSTNSDLENIFLVKRHSTWI